MEVSAFRNIGSALAGITAGATAGGAIGSGLAGGGSFSYTPDQMRSIVTRLTDLAHSYEKSLYDARHMALVEGPGLDHASRYHANAAVDSGKASLRSIEHEYQSCLALAQTFQDTLDAYLGTEERNVININQAGSQDDRTGPQPGI
ncbi:MAG TPA: hypothetical protein VHH53_13740 [Pseudonocardiaceae bacterium]|nr:hypothetical protein [Pseudonocardiaceae bacterium]